MPKKFNKSRMEIIQKLREETRELHEQVEEQNPAKQIMDHSIDKETYKLLLFRNFIAYEAIENAIKDFIPVYNGKKHKQLKKDLEQLGVSVQTRRDNYTFKCHSKAEALGAAYVVEGSVLGGMVLARNLKKCNHLSSVKQYYFFNGDKENLKEWNSFKTELAHHKFSEVEEKEAVQKAKEAFKFFQSIFSREFVLS